MQTKSRYVFFKSKNSKKSWDGVPVVIEQHNKEIFLSNQISLSLVMHIIFFLLFWGLITILDINNIQLLPKPKDKMKDIEFILDSKESHSSSLRKTMSKANASHTSQPPSIDTPIEQPTVQNNQPVFNTPKTKTKSTSKAVSKSTHSNKSSMSIPDFSMPMPNVRPLSGGSSGSSGRSGRASRSNGSDSSSFNFGDDSGSGNGVGSSRGNGFDKNATRKAISSYDISPYVNELKRNIRWNWKVPKDNKRVELFLRIARDGRLIILNVKRTSEVGETDNAALNAVKRTLPLNPLPAKYTKNYLDVIFTFDSSSNALRSRF